MVEALRLDLVGPDNTHPFAHELLPESPRRWYLTGFLVPTSAPAEQRRDAESDEEIDSPAETSKGDDNAPPDRDARKSFLPSSMGVSILLPKGAPTLDVTVEWGDYIYEGQTEQGAEPAEEAAPIEDAKAKAEKEKTKKFKGYRRESRSELVKLPIPRPGEKGNSKVPNSRGLELVVTVRQVTKISAEVLPAGSLAVSVFLVNNRAFDEGFAYKATAFQTTLIVDSATPFLGRPNPRGTVTNPMEEWDEAVADLQFRDAFEFSVGHGVATLPVIEERVCRRVKTTWIPQAEVERVAPTPMAGVELRLEELGKLPDGPTAKAKLEPMIASYLAWIEAQEKKTAKLTLNKTQRETAAHLLSTAGDAARRIEKGIATLQNPQALEAFRIANRTMARAARQREGVIQSLKPAEVAAPTWRPFQLAFILLNLPGIESPLHSDRDRVDLLFFPTGGGKTEAYLGLAAFTMVLRRLRNPGLSSAGVTVLMRYTMRLLTLDQLGRAAGLMCALELEREKAEETLGEWPFEIGLWVGMAATPNRMGHEGYKGPGADDTAYVKTRRFKQNDRNPSPIPIENCPWCGTKFTRDCFYLTPNPKRPIDLRVQCADHNCDFSGNRFLPILGVDEPIYRRLPAFIIATVDKFAALPWTGRVGTLFGRVQRHDANGFYGPCDGTAGTLLPGGSLMPPDLIIQDELHLISGPLGTIAGVYETAIEELCTRQVGDKKVRPKIVASTATVRRADRQIRALFGRHAVSVFPPPGPDRRDSFFAETQTPQQSPARLYVGIAAQGRSLKVVLLRSALALLSAGQTLYLANGGAVPSNPADPYMSLLGYFNSLRELGGSRRIMEDEVLTRLAQYSRRRRREPEDRLFSNRDIQYEVLELTSRVSTNNVAAAKRRLASPMTEKERVDVALATNMISVGLDIMRLGLMVVLGQPKTSAEYIQATSRVGRDAKRPGLVVTLLNVHKPRDRSHYERFTTYHETFYRSVEVTSVTPFSPRALDRALSAALVGLARQGILEMTPATGASTIAQNHSAIAALAEAFVERAENHDSELKPAEAKALSLKVRQRCEALLGDWGKIYGELSNTGVQLQYQKEEPRPARLLHDFLDPDLLNKPPEFRKFRANRSMRDVETAVDVTPEPLRDWGTNS
jgi:hypothetical protein